MHHLAQAIQPHCLLSGWLGSVLAQGVCAGWGMQAPAAGTQSRATTGAEASEVPGRSLVFASYKLCDSGKSHWIPQLCVHTPQR